MSTVSKIILVDKYNDSKIIQDTALCPVYVNDSSECTLKVVRHMDCMV